MLLEPANHRPHAYQLKVACWCLQLKEAGLGGQMVGHAVHASGDQYLAPVFKFDEEEHAAVLQEAATMDRVLSGQQARPSIQHRFCPQSLA